MKVHVYKVNKFDGTVDLEDLLKLFRKTDELSDRVKAIGRVEMRLEDFENKDGLWYLDFVKIRTDHGPGKVGINQAVEGFEFDADEGFGEETAALYDPATKYILVQYNHYGVRSNSISEYLSEYDDTANNIYEFIPKLDDNVERRLRDQTVTRKLAFTIDVSKMSAHDRRAGKSFSEAISYGRETGADKVKVEISVDRANDKGLIGRAKQTVNSLLSIVGANPTAVTKLEVTGKENHHGASEVLDLLGHRLVTEFSNLQTGDDLRYPRQERWNALLRAKNGWAKILR